MIIVVETSEAAFVMKTSRILMLAVTAIALLVLCACATLADEQDVATLLDGVSKIASPGVPGPLCVFGDDAFVVTGGGWGKNLQRPLVAAARYGEGRAVIFGHGGFMEPRSQEKFDTGRLLLNCVRWAGGSETPRLGTWRQPIATEFLTGNGMTVTPVSSLEAGPLGEIDVMLMQTGGGLDAGQRGAVLDFVRGGGGLLAGGLGWGWLQLHPGMTLADYEGNQLIAELGIVWGDEYMKDTIPDGFAVSGAPSELLHTARALDAIEAHASGATPLDGPALGQASLVVTSAMRELPPGDEVIMPRLRGLCESHAAEAVPTHENPVTVAQPLARMALTMQLQELAIAPPDEIEAHPAAEAFPGAVAEDAEQVTRSIEVDTTVRDWHSTGLYAAPGEVIEVTVPAETIDAGLRVRIGAHKDRLWGKDKWRRCPEITTRVKISAETTRTVCAFGGLVYIDVPRNCEAGTVPVTIAGVIEAPLFVLGQTTDEQWLAMVADRPGPWAEIASDKVVLTVPTPVARELTDPTALMQFWNRVMDADADLSGRLRERERPERYVADEQISAGYMHSGYPIMTHLDAAPQMLNREDLLAGEHAWGLFHEMGHNHQSRYWTFGGTGEVTVNLFSLYVLDTVCGMTPAEHGRMGPEACAKMMQDYLDHDRDFAYWRRKPFLALVMYVQLQEAFGWDAYRTVFAEYRDAPEDELPKTDAEERDQWLVRMSRTVGRDLGPFFEAWNIPTSSEARASVADLPKWLPENFSLVEK